MDLPVSWGDEAVLKKRLGPYIKDLRIKREVVRFRSLSPSHWVEFMKTYFGPAIRAFQHSPSDAQEALSNEMTELMREYNRSSNGTALGESEYLGLLVATRTYKARDSTGRSPLLAIGSCERPSPHHWAALSKTSWTCRAGIAPEESAPARLTVQPDNHHYRLDQDAP